MHRQPLRLALSSPRARTILSSSIVISLQVAAVTGGLAMVVSMATQVPAGLTRQARMVVLVAHSAEALERPADGGHQGPPAQQATPTVLNAAAAPVQAAGTAA